jgi:hypothetical protein
MPDSLFRMLVRIADHRKGLRLAGDFVSGSVLGGAA